MISRLALVLLPLGLALGGCHVIVGLPVAVQVITGLAGVSTLANNEADCRLVKISDCKWPDLSLP